MCSAKMKGMGDEVFPAEVGRIYGIERGRAREGIALLLSRILLLCVQ